MDRSFEININLNERSVIESIKQKLLHDKIFNNLNQDHVDKKLSLVWLKKTNLSETEGSIFAIQDQVINIKY